MASHHPLGKCPTRVHEQPYDPLQEIEGFLARLEDLEDAAEQAGEYGFVPWRQPKYDAILAPIGHATTSETHAQTLRRMLQRQTHTRLWPLFVYFMTHGGQSNYIGISSNPHHRVRCHNREHGPDGKVLSGGAKFTLVGAPNWRLTVVIGPFYRGAKLFWARWRKESRKADCRLTHGILKARAYMHTGLRIYAADPHAVKKVISKNLAHYPKRRQAAVDVTEPIDVHTTPDPRPDAVHPLPDMERDVVLNESWSTTESDTEMERVG